MITLFNEILYQPLFNGLILLYQFVAFKDLGLAIILFTILIRIILFPLFHKMTIHQKLTQEIQPHIKRIQEEHKGNQEKQTKAILELYKSYNTNPLTPFLLLVIQIPIFIALYKVFTNGFGEESFNMLYSFMPHPEQLNFSFLGLVDLHQPSFLIAFQPSFLIAFHSGFIILLLAAIAQYFQAKLSLPEHKHKEGEAQNAAENMGKKMIYLGPVLTILFLHSFPAALSLYWLTFSGFSVIQQIIVNKSFKNGGIKKPNK